MGALPPRDVGHRPKKRTCPTFLDADPLASCAYARTPLIHPEYEPQDIQSNRTSPARLPLHGTPTPHQHTPPLPIYHWAPRHLHCVFIARRHPTGSTSPTRRWLRITYASRSESLGARLTSDATPAECLCLYDFLAPLISVSSLSHANPSPF
jgi:hypothetical protein